MGTSACRARAHGGRRRGKQKMSNPTCITRGVGRQSLRGESSPCKLALIATFHDQPRQTAPSGMTRQERPHQKPMGGKAWTTTCDTCSELRPRRILSNTRLAPVCKVRRCGVRNLWTCWRIHTYASGLWLSTPQSRANPRAAEHLQRHVHKVHRPVQKQGFVVINPWIVSSLYGMVRQIWGKI